MDHGFQLSEYHRSLYGQRLLQMLQQVPYDDPMSNSTQLLAKRRLGMDINQALESQRQEFHVKMESVRLWRENFTQRCDHMKGQLLKFDNFIQDNDRKRARALAKADAEKQLRTQRQRELQQLEADVRRLSRLRDDLRRKLAAYAVYKQFTERVVRSSSLFRELHEVTSRHHTLLSTRDALLRLIQDGHEDLKQRRARLSKFMEDKNDELLRFNNHLAALQARLDAAQSRRIKWDASWTHIQNTAARKTLLLGTVKMAALNLYQVVVAHLKEAPTVPIDDTLQQFQKIEDFIHYLHSVWDDLMHNPHLLPRPEGRLGK